MLTARLSVMMFLEFFIWGAYFVSMALYISAEGVRDSDALAAAVTGDRGEAAASLTPAELTEAVTERVNSIKANAYTAIPLGAILAPLFLGLLADRLLPAQIVNGILHLIGAVLLWLLPTVELTLFFPVLLLYAVVYMPTLGLTNTVAFHSISESDSNAERQFPVIRVFGTIGWIAAGLIVSKILEADFLATQFYVAGFASIALGLYSFALPNTPPSMKGEKPSIGKLLGLDAVALMKDRSFAVFAVCSMLLCIPLAFYYAFAPVFLDGINISSPGFKMSFGQMSEVLFMALMPLFFLRLGVKWMLLVGMLAWVVRYGLFAVAAPQESVALAMGGVLLHGICYDFFFVTGQIYVDKRAPAAIRGQAQGFLVLITQGIGMLIGTRIGGYLIGQYKPAEAVALEEQAKAATIQSFATTGEESAAFTAQANELGHQANVLVDWQSFWIVPGVAAAVIAFAFFLLFREPSKSVEETPVDIAADEPTAVGA